MPVFPLVGSMMRVSLSIRPSFSACSIMLMPILSLTDEHGLKNSSLPATVAVHPSVTLLSFTSGVLPTRSTISRAIFITASLLPSLYQHNQPFCRFDHGFEGLGSSIVQKCLFL